MGTVAHNNQAAKQLAASLGRRIISPTDIKGVVAGVTAHIKTVKGQGYLVLHEVQPETSLPYVGPRCAGRTYTDDARDAKASVILGMVLGSENDILGRAPVFTLLTSAQQAQVDSTICIKRSVKVG